MEFRLLGPVEIGVADRTLDAGHARQRAVLAVLLLDLGRMVPADRLIDRVWGEDPPPSVRSTLYACIARLKAIIASAAEAHAGLSRGRDGYVLDAGPDQLDLLRFRRLTAGATAAEDDEHTAELLQEALALWPGPALAGLESPWLHAMRDALEAERQVALLDLGDVRLRLGRHAALVAELTSHAAAAPADERLIGQLMLALYRSGRHADALRRFDQTRRYLAAELGTEPGPQLCELHQQILRFDPALTGAVPGPSVQPAAPVPRELPPDVGSFTGRAAELAALTSMLDDAGARLPGTVVLSAIGGTAGVGKTTLAVHWSHQVAGRFGDGQLYANLRGFDPSGSPATAAHAIRGFLESLGVSPGRLPASADAQAGLYRSLLADKRMLILLDNVRDEQQVRPLLPASPGSVVIITSRNQLTGLAAADGARLVTLDVLRHAEAVQLLTARIGRDRAAAEPAAVDRIASLCACLPLAVAVAAARAAAGPRLPLTALAAELADSAGRLDALDAADPVASVRAVFSWSTRQLSDESMRLFRLLGLHPGPEISVPAAASLTAAAEPETRRMLGELARAHLIAEPVPGRYAFHDLLRAYAAGQVGGPDNSGERNAAINRVLDHYLHTAVGAARRLNPTMEPVVLPPLGPGTAARQLVDYPQAMAWFEAEHQVLLNAVTLAAQTGSDRHAWQLPCALSDFLYRRGHWQERADILGTALAAATRLDDSAGQALSGRLLAGAYNILSHCEQARVCYASSLTLYQRLGDHLGEAKVQQGLGTLANRQGRYADALGHAEQALRLYQAVDDRTGQAEALNNVGWAHGLLGDYQQARSFCRRSLSLSADIGHRRAEAHAWDSLGYAEYRLGNHAEAAACYQRGLSLYRESGDRFREADALTRLGDTRHAAGDAAQACAEWQQALAILEDLQHPDADQVRAKLASARAAR